MGWSLGHNRTPTARTILKAVWRPVATLVWAQTRDVGPLSSLPVAHSGKLPVRTVLQLAEWKRPSLDRLEANGFWLRLR